MLVLIPTEMEAAAVRGQLESLGATLELCGFGPILAAARTMQAIAEHRPRQVLLLGIAGALSDRVQVGEAYEFSEVVCYGVGTGSGVRFQSAQQLGWRQWSGAGAGHIDDRLELQSPCGEPGLQLLTCCAGSASKFDVSQRQRVYPAADAEDMEGFAVAAACRLANIPIRIIRGISNRAGDRRHAGWLIDQALHAAAHLALSTSP